MAHISAEATPYGATYAPLGAEVHVRECSIEGKIPSDLSGGFYAVGPDPQYPLAPGNTPFDGEGHVRLFRIKGGRVEYRTRYVRTERYVAQDKAGRILMPMYRNPSLDDPSVKGLSRSTANTHVIQHRNVLLALKEDSAPSALDLETLETVDPVYTFEGQFPREQPFTAHPKVCSHTGNIVGFGYEAHGLGSDVIAVFEIDKLGRKVWSTEIRMPFVSGLHDFAVTQNHIAFFLTPLAIDPEQMRRGGIHWSWDKSRKSFLGVLRRGGDGTDLQWIEGVARGGSHTLGAFEDGGTLYFDREITAGNPYPVIPNKDGAPYDPAAGISYLHRISVKLNGRSTSYETERLYPLIAPLPRQDDRYNTVPYRYGFMGCPDPAAPVRWNAACYARVDHQTRTYSLWKAPSTTSLGEPLFAPKRADAREGEGYLLGVAWHLDQRLRSDLLIFDAEHLQEGPIATVRLPVQASPQIHGWWVREDQYPTGS
ncbi:MAG TPA: carotenoid oxygenase family protein [Steroidobacteraceae bacterium]